MLDIGFSELLLVFIIGLIVLGPQRLPVAVKTVVGWVRALRSLTTTVRNELTQELKLQELQDSLKKVEKASAESMKSSYNISYLVKEHKEHEDVTPASAEHPASAPQISKMPPASKQSGSEMRRVTKRQ